MIHFGFNNNGSDLTLGVRILEVHESEKDLGVMVQFNPKVDKQCCKAAKEANRNLMMIKRGFENDSKEIYNASMHCISPWLDLTWIIAYRYGNHISGRM